MRKSELITKHDSAGDYEIEVFDHKSPKRTIICVHGAGVRRWDGKRFFYEVAEHYSDSAVILVDQNQPKDGELELNPLPILISRVDAAIAEGVRLHSDSPTVIVAHSMGCGVTCLANTDGIKTIVFVAPGTGNPQDRQIRKYGANVVNGKTVTSSSGSKKILTADHYRSFKGIVWEDEYRKLVDRFSPVYVFEAGDDEIIGEERFAHRSIAFTKYEVIKGAKHNFAEQYLRELLERLDPLLY